VEAERARPGPGAGGGGGGGRGLAHRLQARHQALPRLGGRATWWSPSRQSVAI